MNEEYTIPVWCDVIRRPAVEVKDQHFLSYDPYVVSEILNKLFKEHMAFQNFVAEVKSEKELQCRMCGDVCEILLDDITKERTCNKCGKGKLEYSIKVMAESEKRGVVK